MDDELKGRLKIYGVVALIFVVIFLLVLLIAGDRSNDDSSGYQDGYDAGYEAAQEDGYQVSQTSWDSFQQYLDGLSDAQWKDMMMQHSTSVEFKSPEDYKALLFDCYVYGFKTGYQNCQNGIWDSETKEYVQDWDYKGLHDEVIDYIGEN